MGKRSRFEPSASILLVLLVFIIALSLRAPLGAFPPDRPGVPFPARQAVDPVVAADGSCLVGGRPALDFKLRDVISGRMLTLLDTARRDYTFIIYLNTEAYACLDSLNMVERLRNRYRDRVAVVAVFLDPAGVKEIQRYLISHQIYPDYALHDPFLHEARRCNIDKVPALTVIGPTGNIVFRTSCTRPVDMTAFTARLGKVLAMQADSFCPFQEARRIYLEAMDWIAAERPDMAAFYLERVLELQPNLYTVNCLVADAYRQIDRPREAARYYSRYLSADLYAYDLPVVKERLRSLAAAPD